MIVQLTCVFQFQEQYIFVHEAILETILCGMNEVDSTEVQREIDTLAEVKDSGMTGFQEKFKVGDYSLFYTSYTKARQNIINLRISFLSKLLPYMAISQIKYNFLSF